MKFPQDFPIDSDIGSPFEYKAKMKPEHDQLFVEIAEKHENNKYVFYSAKLGKFINLAVKPIFDKDQATYVLPTLAYIKENLAKQGLVNLFLGFSNIDDDLLTENQQTLKQRCFESFDSSELGIGFKNRLYTRIVAAEKALDLLMEILTELKVATKRSISPFEEHLKSLLHTQIAIICTELTDELYRSSIFCFESGIEIEPDYPLTFYIEAERLFQKVENIIKSSAALTQEIAACKIPLDEMQVNCLKLILAAKSLPKIPPQQLFYDKSKFQLYLDQVAKKKQALNQDFQNIHKVISHFPEDTWTPFCSALSVKIFDIINMYAFWGTKLPTASIVKQFYPNLDQRTIAAKSELYNLYYKAHKAWYEIATKLNTNTLQANLDSAKKLRQIQSWINELYTKINQDITLDTKKLYLNENNVFLELIDKLSDQINEQAQIVQLLAAALKAIETLRSSSTSELAKSKPDQVMTNANTLNQEQDIALLINKIYQCKKRLLTSIEQILDGKVVDETQLQVLLNEQADIQKAVLDFPQLMESEEIKDQIEKLTNSVQIGVLCQQIATANDKESITRAYSKLETILMENHAYIEDFKPRLNQLIEHKNNGIEIAQSMDIAKPISEVEVNVKYTILGREMQYYFSKSVVDTLRNNPVYWRKLHDLMPSMTITTSNNGICLIQKGPPEIYKLKIPRVDLRIYGYKDEDGNIRFMLIQTHGVSQRQAIEKIKDRYNKQRQNKLLNDNHH